MGRVLETNFASAKDLTAHLGFWPDDVTEERARALAESHGLPVLTEKESESICQVFEPYLHGFLGRVGMGVKALKESYVAGSGRMAPAEVAVHVDCLLGGLGFHFWLLAAMRERERESGIWQTRSERQKAVTAFVAEPDPETLFSRLRIVAAGAGIRLCFIAGGAFSRNEGLAARLDHPDARRSLSSMDDSGEMVIWGRGRLLEEAGVVRYRSKGLMGAWTANVPVLDWKTVSAVSDRIGNMFDDASRVLSGCLAGLVKRSREAVPSLDSGPGDYLEMSYSVLAALVLKKAILQGIMFGGAGERSAPAGRPGIASLFRRGKPGPAGCFILTGAQEIWRHLVSLMYP